MRQKLVSNKGMALRINWCGAKKRNIRGVPNIKKKMRQKLLLSLLWGSPHILVWHPAGKYTRGANQRTKNWPAECLTGRKSHNQFLLLSKGTLKNHKKLKDVLKILKTSSGSYLGPKLPTHYLTNNSRETVPLRRYEVDYIYSWEACAQCIDRYWKCFKFVPVLADLQQ